MDREEVAGRRCVELATLAYRRLRALRANAGARRDSTLRILWALPAIVQEIAMSDCDDVAGVAPQERSCTSGARLSSSAALHARLRA